MKQIFHPGELVSFPAVCVPDSPDRDRVYGMLVKIFHRQSWGDRRCVWFVLRCDNGKISRIHDTALKRVENK